MSNISNISIKQTRKHETLIQCWFDFAPALQKVDQQQANNGFKSGVFSHGQCGLYLMRLSLQISSKLLDLTLSVRVPYLYVWI